MIDCCATVIAACAPLVLGARRVARESVGRYDLTWCRPAATRKKRFRTKNTARIPTRCVPARIDPFAASLPAAIRTPHVAKPIISGIWDHHMISILAAAVIGWLSLGTDLGLPCFIIPPFEAERNW